MNLIERAVARLGTTPQGIDPDLQPPDLPNRVDPSLLAAKVDSDKISIIASRGHHDAPARVIQQFAFGEPIFLPLEQMRERGFVTPAARATATGQEFRSIKGPILEKAFGADSQRVANGHRVAVTSALPGEGKTFCAVNLAISIAATGERPVLLLDADIARPSIATELGIADSHGLIDVLKGDEHSLFGLIRPTNVPGLSILPAGRSQALAGEFLATSAMASVLDQVSASFPDWLIVIDTPPMLAVTEVRSVLQRVGQIVMVVAAGDTPRDRVITALAAMPESENVSLILNKVPESKARLDYYYGY